MPKFSNNLFRGKVRWLSSLLNRKAHLSIVYWLLGDWKRNSLGFTHGYRQGRILQGNYNETDTSFTPIRRIQILLVITYIQIPPFHPDQYIWCMSPLQHGGSLPDLLQSLVWGSFPVQTNYMSPSSEKKVPLQGNFYIYIYILESAYTGTSHATAFWQAPFIHYIDIFVIQGRGNSACFVWKYHREQPCPHDSEISFLHFPLISCDIAIHKYGALPSERKPNFTQCDKLQN